MALSKTHRHRLDVQGFACVDDRTLAQTHQWLRMSPALCGTIAAAGIAVASPSILWGLAVFAALGAVLPFHPFDLIYNLGVRRLTGTPKLPPNGAPRRFACGIGSVWLLGTGALFFAGFDIAGYVVGVALIATAALVATTHFCIPSTVYGALFGTPGADGG
jgi:hypothetical protein